MATVPKLPRRHATFAAARNQFINHARHLAQFWASQPNLTAQEVAEGVAFSMCVALDGDALACGPYELRPISANGKAGPDIAGHLHELFHKKEGR